MARTRIREAPNAGGFKKAGPKSPNQAPSYYPHACVRALPDTPLAGFFAHAEISPVGARTQHHVTKCNSAARVAIKMVAIKYLGLSVVCPCKCSFLSNFGPSTQ
eukprot:6477758-Amphidinium_carterae.1